MQRASGRRTDPAPPDLKPTLRSFGKRALTGAAALEIRCFESRHLETFVTGWAGAESSGFF
jgi:hypothetical protein